MPDYKNVQFRGINTVLKAYENRNCAAWSLWVAKQFLFKYEGSTVEDAKENLEETLAMIEENGSTAIYTLKIYEDLKQGQKITEKMECHGSFNFRLQDDPNEYRRGSNALESKINALQKRIDEYEAEEEEEEDNSALGQINQVLENPVIGKLLSGLFGINLPAKNTAISGIPAPDQDNKASEALKLLKTKDNRIGEHLEKLALIAEKTPDNFKYILSILEGVTV